MAQANMFNKGSAGGLQGLLKDGANHYAGVDESVMKNIEACRNLSKITQTSLGPYGLNKMIINHLDKTFVTSDTAVMTQELEVMHPAAKMMVIASAGQESECGDGTNFVVSFIGELLYQAEELLKQGIHCSDIIKGYELAYAKLQEKLPASVCWSLIDPCNMDQLITAAKTPLASKMYGYEDQLAKLVATAALRAMPKDPKKFDIQNVRIGKISGGNFSQSEVVSGLVCARPLISTCQRKENVKFAVYPEGFAVETMESKGTVLLKNAEQLLNYTKGEEEALEQFVTELVAANVGLVVVGGPMSDIATHYLNKYNIAILKIGSKFELQRICKIGNAIALPRMDAPTPEEAGFLSEVFVEEIASHKVTIMRNQDSRIATILLRSGTKSLLEEMERAIDDSIHCVQQACIDGRFLSGAGATEIEMAKEIQNFGNTLPGMDQYAVMKFAEALEIIPKMLSKTCGQNIISSIGALYSAHTKGNKHVGINVDGKSKDTDCTLDACKENILDHFLTKQWALQHAVDAAITILRVDQIIIAKQAGGPKTDQPI